ncbi:MAG: hypothetical protein HGA44_16810 [Cellulomonadaceae bacterium]|nr:hypothetical protein [Cellulomonadaceae bacterium]
MLPLDRGVASFTTSALAADVTHTLSAHYQGHGADAQSWSEPHTVGDPARSGTGTVTVTIPVGSLTITSPAGGSVALEPVGRRPASATGQAGVAVTDTRAGDLGFTVSAAVVGAPRAAVTLADARAVQVPGNGLQAADVTIAPARHRLAGPGVAVATYPAGRGTGTVVVTGTVLATGAAARLGSVRLVWTVL